MSSLSMSANNLDGLAEFRLTEAYGALPLQERGVLDRFWEVVRSGTLEPAEISRISGISDGSALMGGVARVSEVFPDGIPLPYFIGERPYILFYNPETTQFFYFRNSNIMDAYSSDVDVFDVTARTWVHVNKNAEFFGPDEGDGGFSGLIKADFIYVQFNKDVASLDKMDLYVAKESLEALKSGEKYYCQEQKGNFCQIHAANAFLGYYAVKPSELVRFLALDEFDQQHVEGLAAGDGSNAVEVAGGSNIETGVDLGVVVQYLRHLESDGDLRVGIQNLKVGKLSYEDGVLSFIDDESGQASLVDEEFLAANSRAILGTYVPAHARALRKNSDGSWTEIDSMYVRQNIHRNFRDGLIEMISAQKVFGGANTTLPCAFA